MLLKVIYGKGNSYVSISVADYYSPAEVMFAGLPNIHAVRNNFADLRASVSCSNNNSSSDGVVQWLSLLTEILSTAQTCVKKLLEESKLLKFVIIYCICASVVFHFY